MATVRTLIGNIKGPKGDTGATGATGPQGPGATIEVGTVSTTAYGNPVQITNSGTETDAVLDFVIPQGKPGEQTTKMSSLTLDTITTQTTEYPIPAVGDVGSTAWGKIVKFFNDIKTAVTGKVDTTSIVNNLTSTSTDKPLSAAQGKALNDALSALGPTQYSVHGLIANEDGAFRAYGSAHIFIVGTYAYISYMYKVSAASTTSNNFNYGLSRDLIKNLNTAIPSITPYSGGIATVYDTTGSIVSGTIQYGMYHDAKGQFWALARLADTSGTSGDWPSTKFPVGQMVIGVAIGRVSS